MTHPTRPTPEDWRDLIAPFRGADNRKSALQLSLTFGAFVLLWLGMLWSLRVGYWLTLALAFPTAGFLMRLFMIQHDCGHGSYFTSRRARDWVGFCIGVLTLIPYQYWKRTHAYHHAHSGDLDFRGFGDIDTLTVGEYRALPFWKRVGYRIYRHPVVLLGIGPPFHFLVKHRYPWDIPRDWRKEWASVWWTNLCLVALVAVMWTTIGIGAFLAVQIPVTLITCAAGVWLFYVQHQFEETYWYGHQEWDFVEASLYGSSHLVLPRPLQWLTAWIGIHHVHHLNSLIPNYRLEACLDANPELQVARKVTLKDGWDLLWLTLWDERSERLIRFSELKSLATA